MIVLIFQHINQCRVNIIVKYQSKVSKDHFLANLALLAPHVIAGFHPLSLYFIGKEAQNTKLGFWYKLAF